MALSIKNPDADRLARELAAVTGEDLTEAVTVALQERLERVRHRRGSRVAHMLEIGKRCAKISKVSGKTADEILNYDERGLPR